MKLKNNCLHPNNSLKLNIGLQHSSIVVCVKNNRFCADSVLQSRMSNRLLGLQHQFDYHFLRILDAWTEHEKILMPKYFKYIWILSVGIYMKWDHRKIIYQVNIVIMNLKYVSQWVGSRWHWVQRIYLFYRFNWTGMCSEIERKKKLTENSNSVLVTHRKCKVIQLFG